MNWTNVMGVALCCVVLSACGSSSHNTTGPALTPRDYLVTSDSTPRQTICSPQAPSRRWGVVIGVDRYQDARVSELSGAVRDAWNFYHMLASPGGQAIASSRLKLLLNEDATRDAVVGALGNFLGRACPQDQVLVYFAGHGVTEPGRREDAFLVAHDTNLDNLVGTGISMKQLPEFLEWRVSQAGDLLLVIDACHAGSVQFPSGPDGSRPRGVGPAQRVNAFVEGAEESVSSQRRWGVLSSSASAQFSFESQQGWEGCVFDDYLYEGGLFTCHLLRGLSGFADDDRNGQVTLGELEGYLKDEVVEASQGTQIPQLSGSIDRTTVLSDHASEDVKVPVLPERYQVEESTSEVGPWLWVGGGLTAAALIAGGAFALQEGAVVEEISAGERDLDRADAEGERDRWRGAKVASLSTALVLGTATAVGLAYGLWAEPQDIDDVYEMPPRFRINFAPVEQGGALSLDLTW